MNPTHIHLLINHLPILGSIIGGFVLAYALWARSNPTKMAAYYVLIVASIGAVIAYLTGEPAEETVEKIPGISKSALETHEDAAIFALVFMIVLGVSSIAGLLVTLKKPALIRTWAIFTLVISLFTFSVIARTGYLGGLIRHTEVKGNATLSQEGGEEELEEEED